MIPIDLSGKNALVTGATGELGRVLARNLAVCGANVALHYFKNQARALDLQRELSSGGRKAAIVQGNVTDGISVTAMQKTLQQDFGPVDILVINAVEQYPWKSILDQPVKDFEGQFQACVMQSVLLCKAFVPAMIAKRWGRVIGINTECAMQYQKFQSAYVSGKRGMDGLLRVLAREVGEHRITVNQVAPGWTITEKDRINRTEKQPVYEKSVPLKRRGEDQEIAHAVAFLASDLASFITGAYIPVCGGNVMPAI
jgi:3-oxoacyl-[acyl-carrier protein] reductase